MALLRILLSLSIGFISTQSFGQVPGSGAPQTLTATTTNIPQAEKINKTSVDFGIHAPTMKAATTQLNTTVPSCESKKKIADTICLESSNPDIAKFLAENGQLISMGLAVGSSIGEQCKSLSDTLNKANMVLGLYTAACKVAQSVCVSSCASVLPAANSVRASANKAVLALGGDAEAACSSDPTAAYCKTAMANLEKGQAAQASIETDLATINGGTAEKKAVCGKYAISTQNAMIGAISALKGFAQTKACEKANSTEVAGIDCNNSSSPGYSTPNCLCARGEKSAAECQNINVNAANIKQGTITMPASASAADGAGSPTGGLGELGAEGKSKIASTPVGGGDAAPPVDGGGAGVGGGSSGNGYGQDGAGNPNRRLNTNILGGGFGGGGGGGGSGGGPGYGEMDAKLKKYMPGGVNDPNRSIASQLAKEVTPQAGRTNWEKVRLRYRDNTSSLLNK